MDENLVREFFLNYNVKNRTSLQTDPSSCSLTSSVLCFVQAQDKLVSGPIKEGPILSLKLAQTFRTPFPSYLRFATTPQLHYLQLQIFKFLHRMPQLAACRSFQSSSIRSRVNSPNYWIDRCLSYLPQHELARLVAEFVKEKGPCVATPSRPSQATSCTNFSLPESGTSSSNDRFSSIFSVDTWSWTLLSSLTWIFKSTSDVRTLFKWLNRSLSTGQQKLIVLPQKQNGSTTLSASKKNY